MHFLSLIRCGCFARTNRPDRFICNCDFGHCFGGDVCQPAFKLCLDHLFGLTGFTLFEQFPHAKDHIQPGFKCFLYLLIDQRIRLFKDMTPLGVSENHKIASDIFEHFLRDFTGSHVYHQYVLRAQRRDELFAHLQERKIGAGVYYPVPLHLQECFAYLGHKPGEFPHAEQAAAEVLALPIYPELTDNQQEVVVEAIKAFYAR